MTTMNVSYRILVVVFFVLSVLVPDQSILAQPDLTINRVVSNWPTIEVYFKATCNGQQEYNFNKNLNFMLKENGRDVGNFNLWCPNPSVRCAMSAALVFDASGSMLGAGNAGAKDAGHAFIDKMDGIVDEASIIWFNSAVTVRLGMTTNKTNLHSAMDQLPASGATAYWDGLYVGLQEVIVSGNNPCRAVIALTDGNDNTSIHTPQDIISLATKNRIRVFTIGLGSVSPAVLETIALLTGGAYYPVLQANQLEAVYEEIAATILASFRECLITYQAECMDGGIRDVELSLVNFCSGSDTESKTYRAPRDTSTFTSVEIALGDRTGRGQSEVTIPLDLITSVPQNTIFGPATWEIHHLPACVQFKSISTPPGTLLYDVPMTFNTIPGGLSFTTTESVDLSGNGTLAELVFVLADALDTTACDLDLTHWYFDAGCLRPILLDGEVTIIPRNPIINSSMQTPTSLVWMRSAKDYSPNPFVVTCRVFNTGDKEATNARFRIDVDPADFTLISPFADTQPGTPSDVPIADMSEASWLVRAKTRSTGDSVVVCVTASFDNHPDVTGCHKIWITPTEPILECTITAPDIVADNNKQRYVPMPFELTANVTNMGGMKTDSVWATIIVPPDLSLAGADAPNNHTKLISPRFLLPNQSGSVSWFLAHPITLSQMEYTVQVWVRTSNADSSLCSYKLVIPPLEAPSLQASCQVPSQLVFDETIPPDGAYTPNPFSITLQAVKVSGMPAHDVAAFLWLPANIVLDPPTQVLRHNFGTLDNWHVGDPIPSKTWTVRYTKKLRTDDTLKFKWSIAGKDPLGNTTDTVTTSCEINVPGLKPSYACEVFAPDSLPVNAQGTGYDPSNTFDYTYRIWNTGNQTSEIKYAEVYFPNEGIALDPSTLKRQDINVTLGPGEEQLVTWKFHVTGQITRRNLDIQTIAVDDEGNPIACNKWIQIAAMRTSLFCNTWVEGNGVLRFDQTVGDYVNRNFVVAAVITNTGFQLTNVTTTIKIVDPVGFVEFDSSYGHNKNPRVFVFIPSGQSQKAQWGFRLAKANETSIPQFVEFSIDYYSNETPLIENACNTAIQIDPVIVKPPVTRIGDVPYPDSTQRVGNMGIGPGANPKRGNTGDHGSAAYTFSLAQNNPNPFNPSTVIEYSIGRDTHMKLSVYNLLGKRVATLVNEFKKAGAYRAVFNADNLPNGVYLYRLETPHYSNIKRMVLTR